MTTRREEFKSKMERQLEELHARMVDLEKLAGHSTDHGVSYDTVQCEARQKHLETMRRMKELDEHGEETWHDVGAHVKALIAEFRRAVEEKESTAK